MGAGAPVQAVGGAIWGSGGAADGDKSESESFEQHRECTRKALSDSQSGQRKEGRNKTSSSDDSE